MYFRELFFFYSKKLWNAVSPVDKYIKIIVLLTIPFENEKNLAVYNLFIFSLLKLNRGWWQGTSLKNKACRQLDYISIYEK
jgi:hypothetical protein